MKWYESAGIGVLMGCLYGVTLWASISMRDAYYAIFDATREYMVENATLPTFGGSSAPHVGGLVLPTFNPNIVYMPFIITGLVMIISFTVLFSVPLWYPRAEEMFYQFAEDVISGWRGDRDDDEDE